MFNAEQKEEIRSLIKGILTTNKQIYQFPNNSTPSLSDLVPQSNESNSHETVQSTWNQVLALGAPPRGSASGDLGGNYPNPVIGALAVTNDKIADATIDLTTKVTGVLSIGNGGSNASTQMTDGMAFYDGTRLTTDANFKHGNSNQLLFTGDFPGINFTISNIRTGSSNLSELSISRGDVASGLATLGYYTANTSVRSWEVGLRAGDSNLHIYDSSALVDRFVFNQDGTFQINGLSASQLTGTNSSKQLVSGNLTGDVTTSAFAATIAANAVSNTKSAQMPANTFKGNNTGGSANPIDLTIAQTKTALNLSGTNSGDVTLSGENYLSLTGQVVTVNAVNLAGTNATGTLAAGRFPALSGDVTTTAGSLVTTLATVNSNVGSFGSATQVATFTVNAKGLITAAGNTTITGVAPGGSAGGDLTGSYPSPTLGTNVVSNTKFRQSVALSIVGNSTNSTANIADIAAASDGQVLRRSGTAIGFGQLNLASSNAVTGILPQTNGGTGIVGFGANQMIFQNSGNTALSSAASLTYDGTAVVMLSGSGYQNINISSVSGEAGIILNRPNSSNYAQMHFQTATVADWALGTRASSSGFNFWYDPSSTLLMSLSTTGVLNLSQLTASKVVVTDSSKNLASAALGIGAQTTNGIQYSDGTNLISSANLTYASDEIVVANAVANTSVGITTDQTNGGVSTGNAYMRMRIASGSGGDAYARYTVTGATDWSTGLDNSDSDSYVISNGSAPGSNNRFRISTGGDVTIVSGDLTNTAGNVIVNTATKGYQQKSAAVSAGAANSTLVTGVILTAGASGTITNSAVTTSHIGIPFIQTRGGTIGAASVACGAGSFVITSTSLDTSTYGVLFIKTL